ncbi:MAG: ArnT family glycosyltransferase [Nitrospinales bacterium]
MDLVYGFFIFPAFYFLGDKLRKWWGFPPSDNAEAFVFSTVLGLVAVSLAITVLAVLRLIYPVTAWLLVAVIFAGCAGRIRQVAAALPRKLQTLRPSFSSPGRRTFFEIFNNGILAILVFMALTLALAPPVATDALVYHLAVPKAYLQRHGLVNLPNNIYSFFPLQFEMVYLFCLMLKGGVLAQLAGLGMTLLVLSAMVLFYKRHFSPRYACLVPVVFFATPTVWWVSSVAYVDAAAAGLLFLSFYAWDRWRLTDRNGWFLTMITLAGCAVATKLTAIIALPLVFLGIVLQDRDKGNWPRTLRNLLLSAVAVAMFLAPWLVRNFHYTGNPVAPFLMQFFGGTQGINWDEHRSSLQFQYYRSFGMGHGLKDFFLLPVNLTFFSAKNSLRFDGEVGALYLLLLPGLFWLRQAKRLGETSSNVPASLVFLFAVFLISWFTQSQYIRLLIPSLVFLSLLAVLGFDGMMRCKPVLGKPATFLIHGILAVGIVYNLTLVAGEWVRLQPVSYLAGLESRDRYLARHVPSYPLFQTINKTLDKKATVLFVYMRNLGYLCDRNFISDTFFEAYTLKEALRKDPSVKGIARRLGNLGVTHLLFDNHYVFGKDSVFTAAGREALKNFLNSGATLVKAENGFYLYRLATGEV